MNKKLVENISIVALIVSNCVPLIGVIFFEWSMFSVVLLFWSETLIIGFFNIFKIIIYNWLSAIFKVPTFIIHFGIFMALHYLFLVVLFANDQSLIPRVIDASLIANIYLVLKPLAWSFVLLFVSHTISFFVNYVGRGEYKNKRKDPFIAPYGRILVMHVSIILGGIVVMFFHQPILGIVILIALKTFVDLAAHAKQHGLKLRPQRNLIESNTGI